MINYILPLLIIVLSFSPKPAQNTAVLQSAVSNITQAQKIQNVNNKTIPPAVTPTDTIKKENPKPAPEPQIPATYKPAIPTIHETKPGEFSQPTPTSTPTPTEFMRPSQEIRMDPLPTVNPCYCDPSKEMLCLDVYNC